MNRWPTLVDYLVAEILEILAAVADGSYFQSERDPQIHLCGEGTAYENWGGGEGE